MIKLGTHNSLSYHKCQWWLRPFSWIGKCQSLTIEEQYKLGVRYFDIRVKYTKEGKAISGHGLLTYNINVEAILYQLHQKRDKDIVVRLFLENSKSNPRKDDKFFQRDVELWTEGFFNLTFVEGGCRYDYKTFIPQNISVRNCYAEYWKMKFCIPNPKKWAKEHNEDLHKDDNKDEFSIYDFIEIGI